MQLTATIIRQRVRLEHPDLRLALARLVVEPARLVRHPRLDLQLLLRARLVPTCSVSPTTRRLQEHLVVTQAFSAPANQLPPVLEQLQVCTVLTLRDTPLLIHSTSTKPKRVEYSGCCYYRILQSPVQCLL